MGEINSCDQLAKGDDKSSLCADKNQDFRTSVWKSHFSAMTRMIAPFESASELSKRIRRRSQGLCSVAVTTNESWILTGPTCLSA